MTALTKIPETKSREFAELVRDPVRFQRGALNRRLWSLQREIAYAIDTEDSVSVAGCHASGKSYVAAGAILHHLASREKGIALTIAPTLRQVKLMWQTVELARQGSLFPFPECSTLGLRIHQDRYGLGFSASKGVNAQGFHGGDVLIITDESPGIKADVWDAIDGIRAGGRVRVLKLGNPTVPSGPFFEDFRGRNRRFVHAFNISAFDTPNLAGLTLETLLALDEAGLAVCPFPSLITRKFVKEMYFKWGPNNPRFQSRVLGQFPAQSQWSIFTLQWIEQAARPAEDEERARVLAHRPSIIQVGIDVAAGGDDETAACARMGGLILKRQSWSAADVTGEIDTFLSQLKREYPGARIVVVVDVVGVGHGLGIHLANGGNEVYGFKAGERAVNSEMFTNTKAEAYWHFRELLEADAIRGVEDEDTKAQLADILYRETPTGRIEIESKEEMQARGVNSPDRAEALIMSFARIIPASQTITHDARVAISAV